MPTAAWKQLLAGAPWFQGEGNYPIAAYSEFMPPPRLGVKPYSKKDRNRNGNPDPHGWQVTEYEEAFEFQPGFNHLASQFVKAIEHLCCGRPAHGISRMKLLDNPYWPAELAQKAGALEHEHHVLLLPLSFSRTQDDKGRLRWTLFGASEQGPGRAFWKGFFAAPGREAPEDQGPGFITRLLKTVYKEPAERLADLRQAGFRILPQGNNLPFSFWREGPLPSWTRPLIWNARQPIRAVKYLLTFRPFQHLPASIREAYLDGHLHLLPCPASLVFWGCQSYLKMQEQLPLAMQIPLLHMAARNENPHGLRVPQSGWLHEPRSGQAEHGDFHGPVRNTFKRSHRWARVLRDEDELALIEREDKLLHVLFSTIPDDLGLYGKPMARNVQLWTRDFQMLLDGPKAVPEQIKHAAHSVQEGGLFGYRFQYPAMRVGRHEIYWHRPLAAYQCRQSGQPALLPGAPLGWLTGYDYEQPQIHKPIELWPRLHRREPYVASLHLFEHARDHRPRLTSRNIRRLLDAQHLSGGKKLDRSLARQLLCVPKHETLDAWLDSLPEKSHDPELARLVVQDLRQVLAPAKVSKSKRATQPKSITYNQTANREFEINYWKTIATLAEGQYLNKNNADCVRDSTTQRHLPHHQRDLEALGDYLLTYYRQVIKDSRMAKKALAGEMPFQWRTDFDFSWSGGWLNNQEGHTYERNIVVVIPGRNRRRAVIMADHYDTAYMEDHYAKGQDGNGPRLAASGADDNHSATAALMLGAPIFLELSRKGKLACDIWLVHLTGEEFPADCLGARHLCQRLVEGNLKIITEGAKTQNLSKVQIRGVYILDMVAHNNDHDLDVFQMAPGTGRESFWLAQQSHLATEVWNANVAAWNRQSKRRGKTRSKRSANGNQIPAIARHPYLHGEVRLPYDPRSTLYNTDGQIFSDAGIPVVLFMENYDITRTGYHDSHDTMENIDLDYGAGVAAIAIESVARAATEKAPF
jgi:hypothetical protein